MNSFQSMVPKAIIAGDIVYILAIAALLYLLAVSAIAAIRRLGRFSFALLIVIVGQVILHLAYGEETFLYGLHYVPPLVLLFAQALRGREDAAVRFGLVVLIVFGLWNNFHRFLTILAEPFRGTGEYVCRLLI
jgi:hypothetical protein